MYSSKVAAGGSGEEVGKDCHNRMRPCRRSWPGNHGNLLSFLVLQFGNWKSGFFYEFLKNWDKLTQGNEEKWKTQTAAALVASTGID